MLLFAPSAPQSAPPGFGPAPWSEFRDRELPYRNWSVSFNRGRLQIEDGNTHRERKPEEAPRFPGPYPLAPGLRVADGWLYPSDVGEWGGGIFWFDPKGGRRTVVSDANTRIVARLRGGVFAVQSLDHLMFNFSRLVRVERVRGKWTTRLVTDLHLPILSVVQDGRRFIYLPDARGREGFVSTLEPDGRQREIFRNPSPQTLLSLARAPDGTLWIGTSHMVLRLTPDRRGKYAEQWFAPIP